jgi:hypothetical protein
MQSHAGNAQAIAHYQALLTKINEQLDKLGLTDRSAPAGTVVARDKLDLLFLRMPTIQAAPGLVHILASDGSVEGIAAGVDAGRILAHGDASIKVVNNTPFGMEITDISIRQNGITERGADGSRVVLDPGAVWFNGFPLSGEPSAADSVIDITQDAYPKSWYTTLAGFNLPDAPQDIYVRGQKSVNDRLVSHQP